MRPTSLFALLAASVAKLGRGLMFRGAAPVDMPPIPSPQRKHGSGGGGAGTTLPKKKRLVRGHQETPLELRHGAQRRRAAFANGLSYEARSRHDGRRQFNEISYAEFKAA